MDRNTDISTVLFAALCNDLGVCAEPGGSRFDPFPGGLPPEISGSDEFARHALLASVFKKSEVESSDTAEQTTLDKFLIANRICEAASVEDFYDSVTSPTVGYSIATARELLYKWFDCHESPISMGSIEVAARFGPGRSVGLGDKPTLLYFKVGDSKQTVSSPFIRSWYEQSVAFNPLCEAAEMARKARHGEAQLESSGSLAFVPKSYASKRIVVTEPSLNTYFQLGLGKEMERILRSATGIDLTCQPDINQEMARKGSLDGEYCTMDLQQCSDFISHTLADYMFPKSVMRWFNILRMKTVLLPKKYGRREIELHMLSTMGNGFTFPMQTILLSALVLGVYDTLGIDSTDQTGRRWAVFGDDIIVTKEAYSLLTQVLATLGLRVNVDKSFSAGKFRESCGTDWFEGVNVRGVYLKRYSSDQDLFSCFNRLAIWSADHDIPLTETLSRILAFVEGPVLLVPPDEQVTSGILTPYPYWAVDGECWRYQAYVPTMDSFSFEPWEEFSCGVLTSSATKNRRLKRWLGDLKRYCQGSVNEPAVLKALLAGGVRRNRILLRKQNLRFRIVERETPRWGYSVVDSVPFIGSERFDRWAFVVHLAFTSYSEA